jgi:hypothetical protein
VASGTLATCRVIGQSLSVAVAGAVFTGSGAAAAGSVLAAGRETLGIEQLGPLQQTFANGMQAAFVVCAGFAILGVVTALARQTASDERDPPDFRPGRATPRL